MKIAWRDSNYPCRNCGREYPARQLDRRMWCPECRQLVIQRASWVARIAGLVSALALAAWIFTLVGPSPRFLIAYLIMVVAAYFFIYKLAQRVAFEVIRARGVPPPGQVTEDRVDRSEGELRGESGEE